MAIDVTTIQIKAVCETIEAEVPTRVELAQTGCLTAGGSVQLVVFYPENDVSSVSAYTTKGTVTYLDNCTFTHSENVSFQGGCNASLEYPTDGISGGDWVGTVFEKYWDSGTESVRSLTSNPTVSFEGYQLKVSGCTESPPEGFQCGGDVGSVRLGIFGVYSVTYSVFGKVFKYTAPSNFEGDVLIFFHLS